MTMHPAARLARHWPFANGSGRFIDRWARGINLGHGPREVRTSDGFPMSVLADDHIGRHLILSGMFDRSVVQALLDHALPGDCLLDVGANIGYVSGCILAQVPDATAICIEPQPEVFELLERNLAQFGERALARQIALSDAAGELRFRIDQANRGASRIDPAGEIRVPTANAGDFLRSLERLELVKIDVEGHELPILQSMADELARLRPRAILFEHHGTEAAPDGKIGRILSAFGYTVFGVRKRLLRTQLVPITCAADCRTNDYLALLKA